MAYSILVVDDDEDDLLLLASHLKQYQLELPLLHAQTGLEAIQKLQEGLQPNLILVDAQMPLMSGYEFLVWLMDSQAWRHIPVVVWTGAITESEVTRYYRAGANSLMLKQDALQDVESFCRHWFKLVQLPHLVAE